MIDSTGFPILGFPPGSMLEMCLETTQKNGRVSPAWGKKRAGGGERRRKKDQSWGVFLPYELIKPKEFSMRKKAAKHCSHAELSPSRL